jgi:hypothetical protein
MIVGSKITVKEKSNFPCLMKNEHVVVLFSDEANGTIVHRLSDRAVEVGTQMLANFEIGNFEVFDGSVELENT